MRKLLFIALASMSFGALANHDDHRQHYPTPNQSAYQHANGHARFMRADLNRDGRVSRKEERLYAQQQMRHQRGVPVFALDRNRDGFISREERREYQRMLERQREARQELRHDRDHHRYNR